MWSCCCFSAFSRASRFQGSGDKLSLDVSSSLLIVIYCRSRLSMVLGCCCGSSSLMTVSMPDRNKTFISYLPPSRQSSCHRCFVLEPHLEGWAQWRAEGRLTAAGWLVSPAWVAEAAAEAGGVCTVGAVLPRSGGAAGGGVEEAWSRRCCEAGRAWRGWPGFGRASSPALASSSPLREAWVVWLGLSSTDKLIMIRVNTIYDLLILVNATCQP